MPLQGLLSGPAMQRIDAAVAGGNEQAKALVNYYVGQGVGLVEDVRTSRAVVRDFIEEFAAALEDMQGLA
jgi:NAD(P)H-dependent flavin oxidoreductase YrpB (nitropropane dioxygenase family)